MIQAKFGLNWSSGFRGEDFWKSLQMDDGCQVMAIAHTGELIRGCCGPDRMVSGLELPIQSVPITTDVVSLNLYQGEVYNIMW
jgi:hypothetical protein